MKLWPVEHFWLTDLEKKWAKSVQMHWSEFHFFYLIDFLQNPYFSHISFSVKVLNLLF